MSRPWRSVSSHKDIRTESNLAIPPGHVTDLFLGVSTYLPTQANSKGDVVSNARVSLSISSSQLGRCEVDLFVLRQGCPAIPICWDWKETLVSPFLGPSPSVHLSEADVHLMDLVVASSF